MKTILEFIAYKVALGYFIFKALRTRYWVFFELLKLFQLNLMLWSFDVMIIWTGNIFTLAIFWRKNLSNMSKLLRILTISDSFGVLNILQHYLKNTFNIDVRAFSDLSCKIFGFMTYFFLPISAWLLVYVCMERFLMIKYPSRYKVLRRNSVQIGLVLLITILNFAFYSVILFNLKILKIVNQDQFNSSTTSLLCYPNQISLQLMNSFFTFDLINSVVLPAFLMILSTSLLIFAVFQSRSKFFHQNQTQQDKKRHKKDLQFAFSCISLNVVFLALNVPNRLYILITSDTTSDTFYILNNMYFLNFGLSFLVHFVSNKNFRKEVFILLG